MRLLILLLPVLLTNCVSEPCHTLRELKSDSFQQDQNIQTEEF